MNVFRIAASVALTVHSMAHAHMQLGETTIDFASVDEGRGVLTARDDFVERLSPFDRAARLKSAEVISEEAYLAFVADNVMEWKAEEREKLEAALAGVSDTLAAYKLLLPTKVLLVKTTGKEEGNAAYTRANAIVLPMRVLAEPAEQIQRTLCHELFHVLSRANPELREKLYTTIGFEKCEEVQLPTPLGEKKVTNPDAPRNDHAIRVSVRGETRWVVPVLIATSSRYDPERGGEFFNYLELKYALLDDQKRLDPRAVELADQSELREFFEQVGQNTGYIIHPEEILADNFALLVLRQGELPSPEVLERMKRVLEEGVSNRSTGVSEK